MFNILCVVGSKRKNGNTAILVKEAMKAFDTEEVQTELIFLDDYNFESCNGCNGCRNSFKCVIDDDMQKIYPKILDSDAIVLGSPTYFYNITAEMKAFIDRCFCLDFFDEDDRSVWISINDTGKQKYAAVISVAEQHSEKDMGVTPEVMKGSLESLGYRVVDVVKAIGLFSAGEAAHDTNALQDAYNAGEKLLRTLRLRKTIETLVKHKISE